MASSAAAVTCRVRRTPYSALSNGDDSAVFPVCPRWPWPLTLTFKLVRARDQTRLPCEFGAKTFSSSQNIWVTNKKSTDSAINRISLACGNNIDKQSRCKKRTHHSSGNCSNVLDLQFVFEMSMPLNVCPTTPTVDKTTVAKCYFVIIMRYNEDVTNHVYFTCLWIMYMLFFTSKINCHMISYAMLSSVVIFQSLQKV